MKVKIYRWRKWIPARHAIVMVLGALAGCNVIPQPDSAPDDIGKIPRHFVTVAPALDQQVSYLVGQEGAGRRIIFVHGTPGSASGWADYITMSGIDDAEIIAIDRPGFGESNNQGAVVPLEKQAQALQPFLDNIDGKKPILVGHSLGGPIVAKAAAMYPDSVGALLIMAGSLDPALEKIHWAQPIGDFAPIRAILPGKIANANSELLGLKPELEILQDQLASLCLPVTILHGDDDELVPVENVDFMVRHMVNAKIDVTILTGVNHFLPWHSKSHVDEILQKLHSALDTAPMDPCP
ncbi:MAG: alpha/beta hydrolase [Pseudomonadota bacterium]